MENNAFIEIQPTTRRGYLSEIYNGNHWKISFVSSKKDGYRQLSILAMCKDFLNDVVKGAKCGVPVSLYGMAYDPKKDPPLDLEKCRVLVSEATKSPKTFLGETGNAIRLLRKFESELGFEASCVLNSRIKGRKLSCALVESDAKWMHSTVLLSLYTCLLRIGGRYDDEEDLKEFLLKVKAASGLTQQIRNDCKYLTMARESGYLELLLSKGVDAFCSDMLKNYSMPLHTVHNTGIDTISKMAKGNAGSWWTKAPFSEWKRPQA